MDGLASLLRRDEHGFAELLDVVGLVSTCIPEKQVVVSDAGRVITAVEDVRPMRDGTIFKFPRRAVGEHEASLSLDAELAVPVAIATASPFVAHPEFRHVSGYGSLFVDLRPESRFERSSAELHGSTSSGSAEASPSGPMRSAPSTRAGRDIAVRDRTNLATHRLAKRLRRSSVTMPPHAQVVHPAQPLRSRFPRTAVHVALHRGRS